MRIAVFGGTFDPPHLGHLHLAQAALTAGRVDAVLLIPAGMPPHKRGREISPFADRLTMARLLAEAFPRITVDDLEGTWGAGKPNYTVETLRELQRRRPADSWRLLMGADMAITFDTWREPEAILRLAPPLVAARPGFVFPEGFGTVLPSKLSPEGREILAAGVFPVEPYDCASSAIRAELSAGRKPAGLSPEVFRFIREKGLYGIHPAIADSQS